MSKTAIRLGAELDIVTPAELDERVAEIRQDFRRIAPDEPALKRVDAAGQMPAADVAILDAGSPPAGKTWLLYRSIVAPNPNPLTVVACRVGVFVGQPPNVITDLDPSQMIDFTAGGVPWSSPTPGKGVVKASRLYAAIAGAPAAQQLIAVFLVSELPTGSAREKEAL